MSETVKNTTIPADPSTDSLADASVQDGTSSYVHRFKEPFRYNGKELEQLTFHFGQLTGGDALAIEDELAMLGKTIISPTFSGQFLIRMAARASQPPVGADAFRSMNISDYNQIRNKARSFLLAWD